VMVELYEYPLGYSESEARRQADQATLYEDLTEDILRRAGLRQGMHVLDLGCGVGDLSLLAARIVGPSGAVFGLDRAVSSVRTAGERAAANGFANLRFEEAELETFDTEQKFDAVIGRFVLLYLRNPSEMLRRLRHCVRPEGIIAFHEMDMSQFSTVTVSELFDRVTSWIGNAFIVGGVEVNMGSKLLTTFLHAGLPRPTMIASARVESGPTSPAYDYLARTVRSLSPLASRAGIGSDAEIEIDMLTDRLRQDAVENERVIFLPRLVGAWSRLPKSPTAAA
jgi:ubiquinone/menaquinone biosynthesis C-methylase UbiE